MNTVQKTLFKLIDILETNRKQVVQPISAVAHCNTIQHDDLYCDAEKPFITKS